MRGQFAHVGLPGGEADGQHPDPRLRQFRNGRVGVEARGLGGLLQLRGQIGAIDRGHMPQAAPGGEGFGEPVAGFEQSAQAVGHRGDGLLGDLELHEGRHQRGARLAHLGPVLFLYRRAKGEGGAVGRFGHLLGKGDQ